VTRVTRVTRWSTKFELSANHEHSWQNWRHIRHSVTGSLKLKITKAAIPKNKTFYVDGLGCRPGGSGSAWNWVRIKTGTQRMKSLNDLTQLEAEFHALLSVLKYLLPDSHATIFTHSDEVWERFNYPLPAGDQEIRRLAVEAHHLIKQKALTIRLRLILRRENRAVIVHRLSEANSRR
jgi:hypothetical protein